MNVSEGDPMYSGVERRKTVRDGAQFVVVIDSNYGVKFYSGGEKNAAELKALLADGEARLRPEVEKIVAKLFDGFESHIATDTIVTSLDSEYVLRISRLVGREEKLYALMIGRNDNRDSLARAAARYTLTRRQCDVLSLILDGESVSEIAAALCITENTVQGYVKSLLRKTDSRNRPAMVAKVFDWNRTLETVPGPRRRKNEATGVAMIDAPHFGDCANLG